MADLHALANAISPQSPAIKAFCLAVADRLDPPVPPPPPPAPAPLFVQHYSPSDLQALLTAGDLPTPHAYSLTAPDPDHARFEVRPGDQWSNWSGERSQIQRPDIQGHEGERWRWSFKMTLDPAFALPPTFNPGAGNWLVLWEHHHNGNGSPPSTLQIKSDRLVWTQVVSPDPAQSNTWLGTDLAPAVPGSVVAVDVDCLLSIDPVKAKTLVTVNGVPHSIPGPNLLSGSAVYPMWGLYRAPSQAVQAVTFSPVVRLA